MRKLTVFNGITVDGYIGGPDGDNSWAHKSDPEWDSYVANNASGEGLLLFGHTTYNMMVQFWPTPAAAKLMPEVARHINAAPKIVFSRTLTTAEWNNTRVVKGDLAAEVRKLKAEAGPDMVIMGSASIVSQVAHLVDELQLVVNPIAIGNGKNQFAGIAKPIPLTLVDSRVFKNGNVLLRYSTAR